MNKPVIKAILFDLDDTLWEIGPVLVRAEMLLYQWLQQHAPEITAVHTTETLRAKRMARIQKHPHEGIDLWSLRHSVLTEVFIEHAVDPALVETAMHVFSQARNDVPLFDDVLPGMQQLHQHWHLGSVTNGTTDLACTALPPFFSTSIAAPHFGAAKPDAAIFHAACTELQLPPENIAYVGDDLILDVQGAQQVGMQGIWMNRFDRAQTGEIQPDGICTTLFELHTWLTENTQLPKDKRMLAANSAGG